MKISIHVMILPVIYFSACLFISPSFGAFCKDYYEEDGLNDAYNCSSKSSLTNLTKPDDEKGKLFIGDATDKNFDVYVAREFELNCCFYSQPYCPIISWYKDGVKIGKQDIRRRINEGGRQLKVFGSLEDEGNYTCTATTPYRGEFESHTIIIKVTRACVGRFSVVKAPATDVIKLKRGSSQLLVWNFICFGSLNAETVVCRNGNHEQLSKYPEQYHVSALKRSNKENEVTFQQNVTVFNFSRSDNISCRTTSSNGPGTSWVTFMLKLVEEKAHNSNREIAEENFFKEKGVWIVIGVAVVICLVGLFLLWYRKKVNRKTLMIYRPNKTEVPLRYDAFISYSEADGGSFVRSTLKPMLEKECGYTLSLHYREFVPGKTIVDNILDFIYHSRRIVTVVTPKFLESEWCRFEVHQGLRRAIEKPNTLVVIMLNEIPLNQLPKSLRAFLSDVTFLSWDDGKREEMGKKLKSALGPPFTVDTTVGSEKDGSECEILADEINTDTCNHCNNSNNCDSSKNFGSDNAIIDIV